MSERDKHRSETASRRQQASGQKRAAILAAALDVFAANGYAAARLDDVAAKAGVAKGTIYLFFKDKEQLFEAIVLEAASPVLTALDAVAGREDLTLREFLSGLFAVFRAEVLGTRRKEIVRLVLAEGSRFPRIAEFYHREVVAKGLALIARVADRAVARGELKSDALKRFPQLVIAPLIVAVIWDGTFASVAPLDVEGLISAHLDILLGHSKTRKGNT
ncbi:MAG: TetR/AcrR family transcriptional regulator [Proteobacteria bacterium]|nr:TetR/AcrR family transcriptional regulator [Pseudomonadota bacterium]